MPVVEYPAGSPGRNASYRHFGSQPRCRIEKSCWNSDTIVLLGTGTPNADPDHSGPAGAIVVNDTPYLIDVGPGLVRRAAAAFQRGVKGLAVKNLKRAFVTHLHSDHTSGYPDLIFTPWVLERKEPLEVHGPKGIKAMTGHILKAYREDIDIRLRGGEPSNKTGYKVIAHEIKPCVVYKDDNVTVKAFLVKQLLTELGRADLRSNVQARIQMLAGTKRRMA